MINKDKSKKTSHSEEVIRLYKSLTRTVILMMVTAFTLVFVAVAWFVANSRVNSGTSQITTVFEPIKLAVSSRDVRQKTEIDVLKLSDGTELQDSEGKTYRDENGNSFYYTNAETIALRLDKNDYEVSPGAKGKVTFYVIPNGATSSVTLHIGLGAYGEDENHAVNPINNEVINSLINGHILLFDDYSDVNGYSNWLFETPNNSDSIFHNSITVDLSNTSAGDIVPVDFYWIWPTRYQNYVNDFKDSYTKNEIVNFANDQADNLRELGNYQVLENQYRYSYVFLSKDSLTSTANRSEGYDLADEYIGGNAQYLYLTIQTSVTDEAGGMTE